MCVSINLGKELQCNATLSWDISTNFTHSAKASLIMRDPLSKKLTPPLSFGPYSTCKRSHELSNSSGSSLKKFSYIILITIFLRRLAEYLKNLTVLCDTTKYERIILCHKK